MTHLQSPLFPYNVIYSQVLGSRRSLRGWYGSTTAHLLAPNHSHPPNTQIHPPTPLSPRVPTHDSTIPSPKSPHLNKINQIWGSVCLWFIPRQNSSPSGLLEDKRPNPQIQGQDKHELSHLLRKAVGGRRDCSPT